jgi:hypothetical protein
LNINLQTRDYSIFRYMSTFGFVTVNQLCALIEPNGTGPSSDLSVYRRAVYKRLESLQNNGYISSGPAPTLTGTTRSAYFLSPSGASVLSDLREYENLSAPRWLERKKHFVWTQGPHDVAACNLVSNLIALSRVQSSFTVDDLRGGRDCRFYIPHQETNYLFNPDLFYEFNSVEIKTIRMFVEVDTGNVSLSVIRRKALRAFQYFASRKYIDDFGTKLFPRTLFIVNSASRLKVVFRELRKAREVYKGPDATLIHKFPFWLATYDDVDISAVDQWRLTTAPLERNWTTIEGETGVTPFE